MVHFNEVIKVLKILDFEYSLLNENKEIGKIVVDISFDDYYDEYNQKTIYYNKSNGIIIDNYERKLEIKNKMKELKEELKKLEKEEEKLLTNEE